MRPDPAVWAQMVELARVHGACGDCGDAGCELARRVLELERAAEIDPVISQIGALEAAAIARRHGFATGRRKSRSR